MPDEPTSIMAPVAAASFSVESLVELGEARGPMRLWTAVRSGRRFVLKGLAPELRDKPEMQALLRKEFELGMKLSHPGIAATWALEQWPGAGLCIVMEYVDGVTLGDFLKSTRTSPRLRLQLALELADVMVYLHSRGVCHRDLKPDNVMVSRLPRAIKLIDFGHADSNDYAIFKPSAATGAFGAPEQLEGWCGDERSDVYAFGRVMRFMNLPVVCRPVIAGCLAADPKRRPSMRQVVSRLRRCERLSAPRLLWVAMSVVAVVAALFMLLRRHPVGAVGAVSQDVAAYVADSAATAGEGVLPATVDSAGIAAGHAVGPRPAVAAAVTDEIVATAVSRGEALTRRLMPEAYAIEDIYEKMDALADLRNRLDDIGNSMCGELRAQGLDSVAAESCKTAYWLRIIEVQNEVVKSCQSQLSADSTSNLTPLREPAM